MRKIEAVTRPDRRFRRSLAITLIGWLLLAGGYHTARPVFGVISIVTWALAWLGWLGVVLAPAYGVAWSVRSRVVGKALTCGVCLLVAMTALWAVGPPGRTAGDLRRIHGTDLDRLAADYRAGRLQSDQPLPVRLKLLATDGQAHRRCASSDRAETCGVYLQLFQDWRGEDGVGMAYFPQRPDPTMTIATAEGDLGGPIEDLGQGWWLVG